MATPTSRMGHWGVNAEKLSASTISGVEESSTTFVSLPVVLILLLLAIAAGIVIGRLVIPYVEGEAKEKDDE